jgi:hypothetical protein
VTHERASLRSRETPTAAVRSCGRVGGRGLAGSTPRVVSLPKGTLLGSAKPFAVDLRSRAARLLVRRVKEDVSAQRTANRGELVTASINRFSPERCTTRLRRANSLPTGSGVAASECGSPMRIGCGGRSAAAIPRPKPRRRRQDYMTVSLCRNW